MSTIATYPVVDHAGGVCCHLCHRPIDDGQPYTLRVDGVNTAEGDVVGTVVCVYCA